MLENEAWFGARVARGVADAYAVAMVVPNGDPDQRIPLWHSVTKKMIAGKGMWFFSSRYSIKQLFIPQFCIFGREEVWRGFLLKRRRT